MSAYLIEPDDNDAAFEREYVLTIETSGPEDGDHRAITTTLVPGHAFRDVAVLSVLIEQAQNAAINELACRESDLRWSIAPRWTRWMDR